MKTRQNTERLKVTPTSLVTGAKAPSYVFEYPKNGNVDLKRVAKEEAMNKSRLSDYTTYDFVVEKL